MSSTTDLATGYLTIPNAITCTSATSISYSLDICDIGGNGGDITAVNFYYVVGDNYESGTSTVSDPFDASQTATVTAGGTYSFTSETVIVTPPTDCSSYTHFCAVMTVTADTKITNHDSCIILDVSEPSTTNCPGMSSIIILF